MEKIFFIIGTCGMYLLTFYFYFMTKKTKTGFHPFILTIIAPTFFAGTIYLLMSLGYGIYQYSSVQTNILRYVDWICTTPTIIAILAILLIPSKSSILKIAICVLVVCQIFVIGSGALAILYPQDSMAYYLAGCVSFFIVMSSLYLLYKKYKSERSELRNQLSLRLLIYISLIWTVYPIMWMLHSPGISFTDYETETALYMVLDLFAKGVFGYLLLKDKEVINELIS